MSNAFGAEVGDHILKTVGGRIESFAGAKVVGRVATDVFTVALREIDSPIDALEKAQALCREIAEPIDAHGRSVTVLSTIGLALYPQHALEANVSRAAEALIKAADVALLTAKHAGPGACLAYMPENDDRIRNRTLLQQSLHAAFALKQFTLHYQPLVELDTGRILGAEALIRWQHPELGLQRPRPIHTDRREIGLIVPMGTWVMEEALRTLQAWEASGAATPVSPLTLPRHSCSTRTPSESFERASSTAGSTRGRSRSNSPRANSSIRHRRCLKIFRP